MHVLAFFAASDGIVLENLAVRFMAGERTCPQLRPVIICCFTLQGLSCSSQALL